MWWSKQEEDPMTFDEFTEGGDYSNTELRQVADDLLRTDANRELCRTCREDGVELPYGIETGEVEAKAQFKKDGSPNLDEAGNQLYLDFEELACEAGHTWFRGEGERRNWNGRNPVLMEEHLQNRRRREIYPTEGVPDPSIVKGIYNRVHKDGRKVNSPAQRKRNGAGFYR